VVRLLKEVASRGPVLLTRFIAEGNFHSLTASQRYAILMSQPAKHAKSAADYDCLAHAAIEAGNLGEALEHARAALASDGRGCQFKRQYAVVELLLRLEKAGEATKTAKRWATATEPSPEQIATMAELLAKYGCQASADSLFVHALEAKNLSSQQRFGLMCRRAVVHQGLERWRMLIDATAVVPTDSAGRRRCLEMVLSDLNELSLAEVAGQLAERTEDPRLKAELLLRQADLSQSLEVRGRLGWQVYQAGQLPEDRFDSVCIAWNSAKQPERVIELAESQLRSGKRLGWEVLQELEIAYRAAGRDADAQRAASADPEPPLQEPTPSRRNRGGGMGMF
jgi:hypothetical protein